MRIDLARHIRITRLAASATKAKHFTLLIACLGLLLPLCVGLAVPAAAQSAENVWKLDVPSQVVEVRHADGSISSAEFLSEIILLPDGRANGGWGMWERGTPDVLTLNRVFEGRVISDDRIGPFFEFKAQRLSPLPRDELTITLRPAPGQGFGDGSVRFLTGSIQGAAGEPLSFVAKGKVLQLPPDSSADFNLGYISAPPQTVVVQTLRGMYTANFENVALVFPGGRASGLLVLSTLDGALSTFQVVAGLMQVRDDSASVVLLRARGMDARSAAGDEITVIVRPSTLPHQEDLIYDIAGTQVHAHFEAQGGILIIRDGMSLTP